CRSRYGVGGQFRLRPLDRGAKLRKPTAVGTWMRHEDTLRESERQIGAHLVDALEPSCARVRDGAGVSRRGQVAKAEPGIIMARADDPVEIDLAQRGHRGTARISSPTSTSSSSAASRSMQIPFFGSRLIDAQQARNCVSRPVPTSIFVRPPSAISQIISVVDSRMVLMRSVAEVTVGPPSKMST